MTDIYTTDKKYSIIYADPPWQYFTYSKKGQGRSAESHYQTMPKSEIQKVPIPRISAKDSMALQGMSEKQAGQFIKGLCGYAFEGKPFETKDAKLATAYAYAKVALDVSVQNRENGKKGGLIMAERMRGMKQKPKRTPVSDSPMDMLLKGIVLSVADEAGKNKAAK